MKKNDITQSTQVALTTILEKVPFLEIKKIQLSDMETGADIVLEACVQNEDIFLIVEVKNNGQPRVARLAIYQLKDILRKKPNSYGIVVAPYISSEAGRICEENGIGYLDLAGNCLISFNTVYIRQGRVKNPDVERRDLRSLYSPKGERILRVLLNRPKQIWKMADLARSAQVSLGQVANIKKLLLDREWLDDAENGMMLVNPSALLEEWSKSYNIQRNKIIECYSMSEIPEIETLIGEICDRSGLRYALTGFSSAARIAPTVRYQKASFYLDGDDGDVSFFLKDLGWKAVSSGSNLSLLIPYDEGVFSENREMDGITIVSPVQTYLDLQSVRGRGQEAAEAIRNALEKSW